MSKIILSAAIRGAHLVVDRTEEKINEAIKKFGADKKVDLPNTGCYLPIIYGILGEQVSTLSDMPRIIERCKELLPPEPSENVWLPYLGAGLDAGMAALFAYDMEEALKYLDDPLPYLVAEDSTDEQLWLGDADDVILRK